MIWQQTEKNIISHQHKLYEKYFVNPDKIVNNLNLCFANIRKLTYLKQEFYISSFSNSPKNQFVSFDWFDAHGNEQGCHTLRET